MIRYKRILAAALCAAMTVMPAAVRAENTADSVPETPAQESETLLDSELSQAVEEEKELLEAVDQLLEEEAEEPAPAVVDPNAVTVVFNGETLALETYARGVDGVTYVPVRGFFEAMGCQVSWNQAAGTITVTRGAELEAVFTVNSRLVRANSRCWYMDTPCRTVEGSTMIPVRAAAKIFSAQVAWDGATDTVTLTGGDLLESGSTYYDQSDLLWLARIIYHEAGNQPLDGKVGVANVVINRMKSAGFPSTAEGVIFDTRHGVQFVTRSSTKILREPTEQCYLAAKLALEGYETAPGCFYFVSAASAARSWAGRNRTYYTTISGHAFYL